MQAPKSYTDAGTLNIVSGALNVFVGGIWMLSLILFFCVGLFWIIPVGIGIFQIVAGMAMNKGERHSAAGYIGMLGIVAGVFNMNPLSIGAALLALLKVREPEVAGYLSGS